ncbi:MAG: cadmium-translocating P-type ATPase [Candidatus Cloacimonetes bacterium]|nr:cadmium-translocating P-type ATPase [Candidatus Cloacimonadota bacterium]
MTTREYDIHNLDCAHCGIKIEDGVSSMPGVHSVQLDFVNKRLIVSFQEGVENALERLNHLADSIEPGVTITDKGAQEEINKWDWGFWLPLAVGVVIVILNMLLGTSGWLKIALGVGAWLLVGHRVAISAIKSIGRGQVFSEHFLMSIATIGALVLQEYTEAAAVMVLYEIGQWLESLAVAKSRSSIKGILAIKPEKAHLVTEEGTKDLPLGEVQVGDRLLVYPGERVPLDGVVTKGNSALDTSTLTGEAIPLPVREEDAILAGVLNLDGLLEMEVKSVDAESTVSRILQLIENAGARKSQNEKFITRFASYYTPSVVGAALLVFLIPVLMGYPANVWLHRALVFLIVSCPCALVISVPLSYYVGIGKAARKGIIFKGSVYLDTMRRLKAMVFDKTGTLTTGNLKIEKLLAPDGVDPAELIDTIYKSEYTSNHPFAKAVLSTYTADYDGKMVNAYSEYSGKGVLMLYGEDRMIVGSAAFLDEHGFVGLIDAGETSVVHAAKNDIYLGCMCFSDEIRPGMKEALDSLRKRGIKRMVMLSGDREAKARAISEELGLDAWAAELLPQEKIDRLEEIMDQTDGLVAYTGEGMNDAPALARADLGIAMGQIGNPASIETADVVLLNDRPQQLVAAWDQAQRTHNTVTQNILLALGVKVLVMALGVSGVSGLWEAIIADVGVTLLAVLNATRR